MLSDKRDGKNFFFPTQRYNVPSGLFGKIFVSTFAEELDGIQGHKYNYKRMIVFQMVILQRFRLITGAKNIHAQIDALLKSWNKSAFDELMCDYYAAAGG